MRRNRLFWLVREKLTGVGGREMILPDLMVSGFRPFPVRRQRSRGSVLIEATIGIALLGVVAILLARGSLNAITGRYWTMTQNMSDAYMTYEVALAQRVPMDEVVAAETLWPLSPATAQTNVEIGRLPGGTPVTAVVHRTRIPNSNNLPSAGGTGTTITNPGGMEVWKLQSHLVYTIGDATYRKPRTVVRAR